MVDGLGMDAAHRLPFAHALSKPLSLLSAADRTRLGGLSLSGMRSWSAAKADEYHTYALALRAIHNILAPIHRLPPEILSRIFVEAWKDRKSLRLTHVCRLWYSLLLDTSQFWAMIVAGDKFHLQSDEKKFSDEDYLGVACLRSAPRNISLHLSSISPRGHLQLIRFADRITSMQISARTRGHLELLWDVLHTGMPRLENLTVHVTASTRGWTGPARKLSTEELPLLTRLTLPTALFSRSWPNTLQEMALRPEYLDPQFSSPSFVFLEQLFNSLEDYPRLRVLDIRNRQLLHHLDFWPPPRAFPTLELLRIRSHWDAVSAMLSLLTFPSSTRVDIRLISPPAFLQEDLFVPGSALDAMAALIDRVTIHGGPTSTIRGHINGAESLRVSADFDEGRASQFERTIGVFARTDAPVSHLLLAQHPTQRMPAAFTGQTIFPAFPHLTHLALHGRRNVCSELLSALRPPRAPASASGLLPLPLLQHLTVGLATKRRSEISNSLRRGGTVDMPKDRCGAVVAVHFRECCRVFPGVLGGRRRLGHRLSRLEFFSYEEGCMAKLDSDPAVSHADLAAVDRNLVERGIGPLQRLVDGPVVFSGYRFFTQA